ncbi:MAG: pyridoxamine 5'-phosphate oxidase family protein [Candidatus Binatus sp.]|uniref:pyridoxamine 5'-phosphate oxidase family protein n=1 Tax=Candidatus Binatus sp. TaxID=2811406 RepID=UPI00271BBECE|nr:pyridoxamine 5'-phosphate oxidase family protein [Candidatus Binatus sp.]MDO8434151.1 pyridoxamine 5'-phosphate oxidase family protein [Candidatus Binatus sp.]
MPKLSEREIDGFLAERGHLARIATVKADGAPSVVPVWFIYENGSILITPRKNSEFLANVRLEARVAITIDEDAAGYRKVLFEGAAKILYQPGEDRKWDDVYRRIACRYIDDDSADRYLSETRDQPRALIAVERARAKITSWRMLGADEPYTGIWAARYYEPGSKMAQAARSKSRQG